MILFYPLTLNTSYREGGDKVYTYYPKTGHFHLFQEDSFKLCLHSCVQYIYKCAQILINGRH